MDGMAMDFKSYEFSPRELIAALLYLVLGKTMMVFPDYYQIAVDYSQNPPIDTDNEQIKFYNEKVFGTSGNCRHWTLNIVLVWKTILQAF